MSQSRPSIISLFDIQETKMLSTPSGIPFLLFEAKVFRAQAYLLAAFLHKVPGDVVIGVVSPVDKHIIASFMKCFDSTTLESYHVSAFAEHARIGIGTGGRAVMIETRPRRLNQPKVHEVFGIEDVLVFGLDKDDTNKYLNQINEVKKFLSNYPPSLIQSYEG